MTTRQETFLFFVVILQIKTLTCALVTEQSRTSPESSGSTTAMDRTGISEVLKRFFTGKRRRRKESSSFEDEREVTAKSTINETVLSSFSKTLHFSHPPHPKKTPHKIGPPRSCKGNALVFRSPMMRRRASESCPSSHRISSTWYQLFL
jgi:hypothetical protein